MLENLAAFFLKMGVFWDVMSCHQYAVAVVFKVNI
jgi:hypothetical protein